MAPETDVVVEQDETGLPPADSVDETVDPVEAKARRMGWTDQDEFRGHPDRWVDAETYVARADEHLPILKGTVASMNKKMEAQEQLILEQNDRMKAMQADFKEFVGFTRKAEERAYAKALEQLKAEQRQAVEDQDLAKFDEVSAEIDQHLKSNPADQADQAAQPAAAAPIFSQAVFDAWLAENPWYGERPKMALYAQQLDRWLAENKPTLNQAKRLAEISKLVREEHPDYWEGPAAPGQRRRAGVGGSPVEGADGSGVVVREGKKTYANLPAEAKAACDRYCGKDGKGTSGTIPGCTREDYLNNYDWGQ